MGREPSQRAENGAEALALSRVSAFTAAAESRVMAIWRWPCLQVEKMKAFLIKFLFYGVILALAYAMLKYALPFLTPFLVAFCIALLLKPIINRVTEKTKLGRKPVAVLLLITFYTLVGLLVAVAGTRIVLFFRDMFYVLPRMYETMIAPALEDLQTLIEGWVSSLNPTLTEAVVRMGDDLSSALSGLVSAVSTWAVGLVTGAASSLPSFLVKFFITIVASFFFVSDYYKITSFLTRQLSKRSREMLFKIERKCFEILRSFGRAYAILLTLTFVELLIGLSLLRIDYALLIALLTAIVDILPVLGTGTVLIPWAVVTLLLGNFPQGVGLLVLYAIITVVRQLLEPHVVGKQIGLYPLVTLMCMFVGTYLFGFLGLFGLPILVTLLVHLNADGDIHLFK